jgi:hypothetical protein
MPSALPLMVALAVAVAAGPAAADVHGSIGIGPALLLTGAAGDATRWTVAAEVLVSRRAQKSPGSTSSGDSGHSGDSGDSTDAGSAAHPGPAASSPGFGAWGGGLALHGFGGGGGDVGVVAARLSVQAGAAPPRLWLRLHTEAGLALRRRAPMVGLGLAVSLRVWRPLALVIDANAHLVIDGIEETRLAVSAATLAALAW